MKPVAKFEKVSLSQFILDYLDTFDSRENSSLVAHNVYSEVKLPKRATKGSAGYDFFSPISFELKPNETIKIPTGIRCKIDEGYVLNVYPRSSYGFKYRLRLDNTVGIIDSDYYNAKNEGHIFIKITNRGDKTFSVLQGEAFCQGILSEFFVTYDDNVTIERIGGIGSTNKSK